MNKLLAMIAALAFSAAGASAAIDIQEVQSPMGIKAWLVEDHTIPFVAIKILFRGGTGIEAGGKAGRHLPHDRPPRGRRRRIRRCGIPESARKHWQPRSASTRPRRLSQFQPNS